MEKKYSLSFDQLSKLLSSIVFLAVIVGLVFVVLDYFSGNLAKDNTKGLVVTALICVIIIVYAFSPKYYSTSKNSIFITTPSKKIEILKKDINDVVLLDNHSSFKRLKLFSSGGLFGYIGYYIIPNYGRVFSYASRLDNQILILTDNNKYIISPDDLSMIDEIKN